jgi:hypothetical protein
MYQFAWPRVRLIGNAASAALERSVEAFRLANGASGRARNLSVQLVLVSDVLALTELHKDRGANARKDRKACEQSV